MTIDFIKIVLKRNKKGIIQRFRERERKEKKRRKSSVPKKVGFFEARSFKEIGGV